MLLEGAFCTGMALRMSELPATFLFTEKHRVSGSFDTIFSFVTKIIGKSCDSGGGGVWWIFFL